MNPARLYALEKNRLALLLSSLKPLTFLAFSPIFVITEMLIIGYCSLRGKAYLKAKLSAYSSVWKDRANIRQKRERYRRLRKISDTQLIKRLRWNLQWTQLMHIL
jgi:hypothetical protein